MCSKFSQPLEISLGLDCKCKSTNWFIYALFFFMHSINIFWAGTIPQELFYFSSSIHFRLYYNNRTRYFWFSVVAPEKFGSFQLPRNDFRTSYTYTDIVKIYIVSFRIKDILEQNKILLGTRNSLWVQNEIKYLRGGRKICIQATSSL